MSKKPIALSAVSINIGQKALEDVPVGNYKLSSTYNIHDYTNKKVVSPCEEVEIDVPSCISDGTDEISNGSEVSSCEQVESDASSSLIDNINEKSKD